MRKSQHILPLLFAIFLLGSILFLLVFREQIPWADLPSDEPGNTDVPQPPVDEPDKPGTEPTDPVIPGDPSVPVEPGKPNEPDVPVVPIEPTEPVNPIEPYTPPVDISTYLPAISHAYDSYILVNKTHSLDSSFSPGILRDLPDGLTLYGKDIQLEITAATALEAMMLCMRADGITDTYVTSGYRTYLYQLELQNNYIRDEQSKNPSLSREQALAIVRTYSAAPGYSEHQTGLCVDLMTTKMTELDESFEDTEAFDWLQKNACHFGFILRYPADKTDVTGYKYEPWHYRFVGRDAAIAITEADLTLEEYLAQ